MQYFNILTIYHDIKHADQTDFHICLKFIYSEKATKFCEISTLLLSYVVPVKSKVEILQNFVAFSEYMNFILEFCLLKVDILPDIIIEYQI